MRISPRVAAPWSLSWRSLLAVGFNSLLSLGLSAWAVGPDLPVYRSGVEFQAALRQPMTATWSNVNLRSLLQRASEVREVSILIDRRVDPTTTVELKLEGTPFLAGLNQLAEPLACRTSVTSSVVYFGPAATAEWLRTTIDRLDQELTGPDSVIPEPRQIELCGRKTIHWSDLTSPREILTEIAQRYDLRIEDLSLVPHDLWAAGTLPYTSCSEALTCVLLQFDLDFRWAADGRGIQLVPWTPPALLERRYQPRGRRTAVATLRDWQQTWPELPGKVDGNEIVVVGRSEDHERILELQRPERPGNPAGDPNLVPLRRRQFSLRVENVPILAILRDLEKSGITVEYDAAALRQAQIDLKTLVSVDAKSVSAEEFLKLVLTPIPVRFTINDRLITIEPTP